MADPSGRPELGAHTMGETLPRDRFSRRGRRSDRQTARAEPLTADAPAARRACSIGHDAKPIRRAGTPARPGRAMGTVFRSCIHRRNDTTELKNANARLPRVARQEVSRSELRERRDVRRVSAVARRCRALARHPSSPFGCSRSVNRAEASASAKRSTGRRRMVAAGGIEPPTWRL